MSTSLPLSGKVAIVTGSSRNIGASVARRLAQDGATVVVNYVGNVAAADEIVQQITTEGRGNAIAIKADMSAVAGGVRLVEETVAKFGRLDIIALNAGTMINASLGDVDEKSFDEQFTMNVKVPLFTVQAAAKYLQPGGRVFLFSSATATFSGVPPLYLVYTATKGAVNQMVRILAKDLGAKGITVNGIGPGPTDTDLFRKGKSPEFIKFFADMHPQKRIPSPDEIAPIVAFLSREEAGWINGQIIYVNGGYAV